MESKDELKEIGIKNLTCYYFNDIIKDRDIYSAVLLDEKIYQNILVYNILYKTSAGPKPLCIRIDKIVGFIRVRGYEFRDLTPKSGTL